MFIALLASLQKKSAGLFFFFSLIATPIGGALALLFDKSNLHIKMFPNGIRAKNKSQCKICKRERLAYMDYCHLHLDRELGHKVALKVKHPPKSNVIYLSDYRL